MSTNLRDIKKILNEDTAKDIKVKLECESFPETDANRVKWAMCCAATYLSKLGAAPSEKAPVSITGSSAEELSYLWTAFMVYGKFLPNMKFNNKSIKVISNYFDPDSELGFWTTFAKTSLYETLFKHHVTSDMFNIPKYLAKYEKEKGKHEAKFPQESIGTLRRDRVRKKLGTAIDIATEREANDRYQFPEKNRSGKSRRISEYQIHGIKNDESFNGGDIEYCMREMTEGIKFESLATSASIKKQQCDVLITAIEQYIEWRKNKNDTDNRGYTLTIFTWLRHYTLFGEVRANNLKRALSSELTHSPIRLLQEHFENNSRINNHSLDTYLLESIFNNQKLFLVPNDISRLNTISSRALLRGFIMNQEDYSPPDYSYLVAKLYEEDVSVKDNLKKACEYYVMAVQYGHSAAYEVLNTLAMAGNSDAQYYLGVGYYLHKQEWNKGITWCLCAAEKKHAEAVAYLLKTNFSAKQCLSIANEYERGQYVTINIATAIFFYEKACVLKSKEAAFRLGQLYHPVIESSDSIAINFDSQEPKKDAQKAFGYYSLAAEQKDEAALAAMVALAEQIDNDEFRFQLGQIYLKVFSNPAVAFTYFKNLADQNIEKATIQLTTLTKDNPDYAYIVGRLYECDDKLENSIEKACGYYAFAVQHEHHAAGEALFKLANAGNRDAQYTLGFYDYHHKGVVNKAITWCMRAAEQHHKGAIAYLQETRFGAEQYLIIAREYEEGQHVTKNIDLAITFYEKARALNSKDAALYLGHLYQIDHEAIKKDTNLAFHCYLQAAKLGNTDALIPLNTLADEVSAENQMKLSNLYGSFFKNTEKATYWRAKAMEISEFNLQN